METSRQGSTPNTPLSGLADYSQVDKLGPRYKPVNIPAPKRPGPPKRFGQINREAHSGCAAPELRSGWQTIIKLTHSATFDLVDSLERQGSRARHVGGRRDQVEDLGFSDQGSGFRVWGVGFKVKGLGCGV